MRWEGERAKGADWGRGGGGGERGKEGGEAAVGWQKEGEGRRRGRW